MNRIRELRKQKGMTQKELANHLQIAGSTLSYWEMGKYEPDNVSLKKLSKFFLVPVDYILGGDIEEWAGFIGRALSTGTGEPYSPGAVAFVGEAKAEYKRSEFEGLTQEEIEKLAEYAQFLKSQREKRKAGY